VRYFATREDIRKELLRLVLARHELGRYYVCATFLVTIWMIVSRVSYLAPFVVSRDWRLVTRAMTNVPTGQRDHARKQFSRTMNPTTYLVGLPVHDG